MRRAWFVLVCACGVLACCAASSWAVQYTIQDLGTLPGGTSSWANDINDVGQVVGWSDPAGHHACLWQNGTVTELPILAGYTAASDAYAINNNGQIVGAAYSDGPCTAVLWQNGTATDLGTLPGYTASSVAWDINDSGQVVGGAYDASGHQHAFLWQNGVMQDLGTLPGGTLSWACAINDSGQVVGWSDDGSGHEYAVLWQNGTPTALGTLPGGRYSYGYAINNGGRVVGESEGYDDPLRYRHACLWPEGGGLLTDLGTLPGSDASVAWDINNIGQIVGSGGAGRACLWENWIRIELGTLPGYETCCALGINESGEIVGLAGSSSAPAHAVLWRPVPEPASLLALLAGLAPLPLRRRPRT